MNKIDNKILEKYSRQIVIDSIGIKGQEKIFNTKVLIVGCGGLGTSAAQYLSMTGVGKMTAVVAVIFMVTSLSLAYLSSQAARDSVVREIEALPSLPTSTNEKAESSSVQIPLEEKTEELEQKAAPPIDLEDSSNQ